MRIGAAAAKVARDGLADLRARGMRVAVQKSLAGHHHAGGAEAALQGIRFDEGLLNRRQAIVRLQSFDRRDRLAGDFDRQKQT
jgi:hypothetical protein